MATSPTESPPPPPPLFRSQSIQVSQQWPQPTFTAWYGWYGCVYPEHGSQNNLPVSLVNMSGVVVERRFYLNLVHWSVNISLAEIIYVMLNFPSAGTFLRSYVETVSLNLQRLNQWIETKPLRIMAVVCHSFMLTFPHLVCRVSHSVIHW